jgi:hypothetical protein
VYQKYSDVFFNEENISSAFERSAVMDVMDLDHTDDQKAVIEEIRKRIEERRSPSPDDLGSVGHEVYEEICGPNAFPVPPTRHSIFWYGPHTPTDP